MLTELRRLVAVCGIFFGVPSDAWSGQAVSRSLSAPGKTRHQDHARGCVGDRVEMFARARGCS